MRSLGPSELAQLVALPLQHLLRVSIETYEKERQKSVGVRIKVDLGKI